jgi:peptidoglycan/xylan/chitin deacetylase (PgdA/CDA1 family)
MMPRPQHLNRDLLAAEFGGVLPRPVLATALRLGLAGRSLTLCLHRVAPDSRGETRLRVREDVLDEVIAELLLARPGHPGGWLTVSFDDGYRDAVQYVASRAPRWPEVQFLLFVCPEKLERHAGFRWDLPTPVERPFELDGENARPDLVEVGTLLASVGDLRALAALPNVQLGNHTNLHAPALRLPAELVREDYRRSSADFRRLFGPLRHFAFPFGTPGEHFDLTHVAMLRALGGPLVWTTLPAAWLPSEARPGAVMPRCPLVGLRSADELLGWLGAKVLKQRVGHEQVLHGFNS